MQPFPYATSVWPYVGGLPLLTASLMDAVSEPFAGSLVLSLALRPKAIIAAEADPELFDMWEWLRTKATHNDLTELEGIRVQRPKPMIGGIYSKMLKPMLSLLKLASNGRQNLYSAVQRPGTIDFSSLKEDLPYIQSALRPMRRHWQDALGRCPKRTFYFIDLPQRKPTHSHAYGPDVGFVDFAGLDKRLREIDKDPWVLVSKNPKRVLMEMQPVRQLEFPVLRGPGTPPSGLWYCGNVNAQQEQEMSKALVPELLL